MSLKVYKSSAGSGKTSTLVIEYLSLALVNPFQFRQIIALTFTQKATNEMKSRLINNLVKLKNMDTSKPDSDIAYIVSDLMKNTGFDVNKIKAQSKILLSNILHQYGDFGFNTIDSFVVKIVRSFAHNLQLAANFEIELDSEIIIEQAIEELYEEVGKNDQLTKFLLDYTMEKMEEGRSVNIDIQLSELAKLIFDSKHYQNIDLLKDIPIESFSKVKSILQKQLRSYNEKLKGFGAEGINCIEEHGLEEKDCSGSWLYKYFHKLYSNHKHTYDINELENKTFVEKVDNNKDWYAKKQTISIKDTIDSAKPSLLKIINDARLYYKKQMPLYNAHKLILNKISPLALIHQLKQIIDTYSIDNDIIHISEINRKISEVVNEQQAPFIYEKIGQKYNHYLIDEFQDTSVIQWNNLLPLLENSLASSYTNLLVGDAKQAIYRWRDGEVEQFVNLPKLANSNISLLNKQREALLERNYQQFVLNVNYRSKETIVNFNNKFYKELLSHESDYVNNIFEEHLQEPNNVFNEGYVKLTHLSSEKDNIDDLLFENILSEITQLKDRNYKLGDICILARNKKPLTKIADYLLNKGVKVVSSEALYLHNSKIVNLIISFMKLVIGKDIINNQYSILNYFKIKQDTIIDSSIEFDSKLKNIGYNINIENGISFSAYEFTEYIIKVLNLNIASNPFIYNFFDHLLEQNKKGKGSIAQFLDFWENNYSKLVIDTASDSDSVQLLTIHKAKGLEFPIVMFPLIGFNFDLDKRDSIWQEADETIKPIMPKVLISTEKTGLNSIYKEGLKEEENKKRLDDLNLLYVATTRPVSELYIFFSNKDKISEGIWNNTNSILWSENREISKGDSFLSIGKPTIKTINEHKEYSSISINKFIHNSWKEKTKLKVDTLNNKKKFKEKGIQLHNLLSKVDSSTKIDELIENEIKLKNLSIEYIEEFAEIINQLLKSKDTRYLFEAKNSFISEKDIIINQFETIRPDKIILINNKYTIIDYKYSNYSEISTSEKEKHLKQIGNYINVLNTMQSAKIEGILLYLHKRIDIIRI